MKSINTKKSIRERGENESLWQYYARVKKVRRSKIKPLMDGIDTVMKWAAACVYYMNQRDALRYSLADPRVPCDTNIVERAIRPLTIIRKNSYFAQSVDGMKSL